MVNRVEELEAKVANLEAAVDSLIDQVTTAQSRVTRIEEEVRPDGVIYDEPEEEDDDGGLTVNEEGEEVLGDDILVY